MTTLGICLLERNNGVARDDCQRRASMNIYAPKAVMPIPAKPRDIET